MRTITKIAGFAMATLFFVTSLALAGGIPATVKEVKGNVVVISTSDGEDHALAVGKDIANQLQPGDLVTVEGGRIKKAE